MLIKLDRKRHLRKDHIRVNYFGEMFYFSHMMLQFYRNKQTKQSINMHDHLNFSSVRTCCFVFVLELNNSRLELMSIDDTPYTSKTNKTSQRPLFEVLSQHSIAHLIGRNKFFFMYKTQPQKFTHCTTHQLLSSLFLIVYFDFHKNSLFNH